MDANFINVNAADLAKRLTITLRIRGGWRIQLGTLVIKLGCRIAGFNVLQVHNDGK